MTAGERVQLADAVSILVAVDQKIDNIDEKVDRLNERVGAVEIAQAVQVALKAAHKDERVDRRARLGLALTALGTAATFAISLFNATHH